MADVRFLLDKSAWAQARHSETAAAEIAGYIRRGQLVLCTPTVLGILYSARNKTEYERDHARLGTLPRQDLTVARQAVQLQRNLAERGWHRIPLPDVIIGATAAEHSLTVLHYDSDYERISEVAGIGHRWILPRGTGHARDADADASDNDPRLRPR